MTNREQIDGRLVEIEETIRSLRARLNTSGDVFALIGDAETAKASLDDVIQTLVSISQNALTRALAEEAK